MSKPYFTPALCSAIIPLSPYDGITCNAPGDLVIEEGVRCQSCFDEFGGTPLTDESVAA